MEGSGERQWGVGGVRIGFFSGWAMAEGEKKDFKGVAIFDRAAAKKLDMMGGLRNST